MSRDLLAQMTTRLIHRGPDDQGLFQAPFEGFEIGLGARRLAIIDVEAGRQPVLSEDGATCLAYNGETYNFQALRGQLERLGFGFRTRCDSEVVLQAYRAWGVDFLYRLRGMYGLALWDGTRGRLLLARDPVGVKPLYYWQDNENLYFGSEIKALLACPGFRGRLNPTALHHYLTFLYVPPPETMFEGVLQLPPGHVLLWERGRIETREYWAGPLGWLEPGAPTSRPEQFWPALLDSVQAHLISDVPVGLFLSGGLDSSALALAARDLGKPLVSFTIGFPGAGLYDESSSARQVAEFLQVQHHVEQVGSELVEELPTVIGCLDEPLGDASALPNYALASMASQHVKVVLSGCGGDEVLGGYRRHAAQAWAPWFRLLLPSFLRHELLLPVLRRLPGGGGSRTGEWIRLAEKLLAGLDLSPEERYISWNSAFNEAEKRSLLTRPRSVLPSYRLTRPFFRRVAHLERTEQAMFVDLMTYLPGDPLMLTDRLTMACSLEARVPFVDLPFLEFASALPADQKICWGQTKVLMRRAMRGRLPAGIVARPKQGFGTPIDLWLRRELRSQVDRALSPRVVAGRGLFQPERVTALVQRQRAGGRDVSQHVWALLVLELWQQRFVD